MKIEEQKQNISFITHKIKTKHKKKTMSLRFVAAATTITTTTTTTTTIIII
jgi:hypothetical protein